MTTIKTKEQFILILNDLDSTQRNRQIAIFASQIANQMQHLRFSNYFRLTFLVSDVVILLFSFIYFLIYDKGEFFDVNWIAEIIKSHYKAFGIITVSWFFISLQSKIYSNYRFSKGFEVFKKLVIQIFWFAIFVFAVSGIKKEPLFSNQNSLWFLLTVFSFCILYRYIGLYSIKQFRKSGYNYRNVIVVGNNQNTQSLATIIEETKSFGLKLVENIANEEYKPEKLKKILKSKSVNSLYVALGEMNEKQTQEIIRIAESYYVKLYFIPNKFFNLQENLSLQYLDTFPVLQFRQLPLDKSINQIIKRIFDLIFVSLVSLFILSWLFPIIMLIIVIDSGFPVFFVQKRNGINGKVFKCYKFRTMRPNKESDRKPTEKGDKRITRVGAILRKTSIDELAQFINVIKGEMSIVGPRPHMLSENQYYEEIIKEYSLRHYVKPGITGLAQMRGYRGIINQPRDMELRVNSDIFYIRKWSFLMDIFIIIKTTINIIKGDKNAL